MLIVVSLLLCYVFCVLCCFCVCLNFLFFFFFNDTATTEIYTLSLHDALPICSPSVRVSDVELKKKLRPVAFRPGDGNEPELDRKSTRLNSSHVRISYAVFCLKKKKKKKSNTPLTAEDTSQHHLIALDFCLTTS